MFKTDWENELEMRRIIRKSEKTAEIEVWKEDKENREQQREDYVEEVRLLKKENSKKCIVLKEVQDISNLIRKKENELYISANKNLLFNIGKKEKMVVKYTKIKELIGLERVQVEKS